jgi:hypothetical protein
MGGDILVDTDSGCRDACERYRDGLGDLQTTLAPKMGIAVHYADEPLTKTKDLLRRAIDSRR